MRELPFQIFPANSEAAFNAANQMWMLHETHEFVAVAEYEILNTKY